jgi:polysaccharide export outer membrane protein
MSNKLKISLLFTCVLLLQTSCGINRNLLFRSAKTEASVTDSIPLRPATEYQISRDDKFQFQLYTNNGERIVNGMTGVTEEQRAKEIIEYVVRTDGTADLPILGSVKMAGLTVQQAEDTLAKLYEQKNGYLNPFVQVKLTNQRVIVFPGNGSDAKVIPLQNNNTTLMEVIAQAGGIADRGRADRIKLMRVINGKRHVYVLNLSTEDGLRYADMIVQANDYVYIEPSEQAGKEVVESAAPIVSLLSSTLIIFTFISSFK